MKMMWTKEENANQMKRALIDGTIVVKFKKVDGSERVMKCTLNTEIIPEYILESVKNVKPKKEGVMSVWDVEKEQWRSFRTDNVIEWIEGL